MMSVIVENVSFFFFEKSQRIEYVRMIVAHILFYNEKSKPARRLCQHRALCLYQRERKKSPNFMVSIIFVYRNSMGVDGMSL